MIGASPQARAECLRRGRYGIRRRGTTRCGLKICCVSGGNHAPDDRRGALPRHRRDESTGGAAGTGKGFGRKALDQNRRRSRNSSYASCWRTNAWRVVLSGFQAYGRGGAVAVILSRPRPVRGAGTIHGKRDPRRSAYKSSCEWPRTGGNARSSDPHPPTELTRQDR